MADDSSEGRDRRTPVGRSLDRGLGALEALRQAFGESVEEARERGDLTTDRAKALLNRTLERAREAAGTADGPGEGTPGEGGSGAVTREEFEKLLRRIERVEVALGIHPPEDSDAAPDRGHRR
ncbi:hypothetical protein [Gaopeijia maritima]|uniref:Uncharacterized protein n=1 Tax=Gaopeijia maritima TaxID=3119007 RepID=A0ABU9EBV1_9BACT